jgi:hypothetical protein
VNVIPGGKLDFISSCPFCFFLPQSPKSPVDQFIVAGCAVPDAGKMFVWQYPTVYTFDDKKSLFSMPSESGWK